MQVIRDDFIDLIKELKKNYTTEKSISEIKSRNDSWFQTFFSSITSKGSTPAYACIVQSWARISEALQEY